MTFRQMILLAKNKNILVGIYWTDFISIKYYWGKEGMILYIGLSMKYICKQNFNSFFPTEI